MPNIENQFRMKCPICSRQFYVDNAASRIPKHAAKEENEKLNNNYLPCGGSGSRGIVSGTKTKKFGDA
jgi:hypothetical protein